MLIIWIYTLQYKVLYISYMKIFLEKIKTYIKSAFRKKVEIKKVTFGWPVFENNKFSHKSLNIKLKSQLENEN